MKFFSLFSASRVRLLCIAAISLATAASAAVSATDALIDDCEGGTNQNKFGNYWYFYTDSADGGNSKIAGTTRDAKGEIIGVAPKVGEGNEGSAGYTINYSMGTTQAPCIDQKTKLVVPNCFYSYVGIGCMLAPEGKTIDIKNATTITFWAKASPSLKLNVEVATSDVTDFNYYRAVITVGASWTQYTITLEPGVGIAQQSGWGTKVEFVRNHVEKIQWQVHTDQAVPTTGTLNIDQVVMTDYTFIPPELCTSCLSMTATTKALLSDFEVTPVQGNAAGGWWYCYNDGEGRTDITSRTDYSEINAGFFADSTVALGKSPKIDINGHGNGTGNGAYIGFQLGKTFIKGPDNIKPFVGVGASVSDAGATSFYDATADGVTGVMFDYLITGVDYLRLEVVSSNDLSASGIVWSRLLPKGAAWQTAIVPLDSLMLPDWETVKAMPTSETELKKNQLKKIQFAVQDAVGKTGTIAIDNVYLVGASKITPYGSKVLYRKSMSKAAGAGVNIVNRSLVVTLPNSQSQHIGTVNLVNIKGMTIAGKAINAVGGSTANLDVSRVANGMYFTVIKTKNMSGKEFSAVIPVNIY